MATTVRQSRGTFRRSFSGEMANQLSSTIHAEWLTDRRNRAYEAGANKAAKRVERLNDRAKAFERAVMPLTDREAELRSTYEQRAALASRSSGLYSAAVKEYKKAYSLYKAGKSPLTFEQLTRLYDRQKMLYRPSINAYHRFQNVQRAYDGLRADLQAAYERQNAAAKQAQAAYKAYQKRYADSEGPTSGWK